MAGQTDTLLSSSNSEVTNNDSNVRLIIDTGVSLTDSLTDNGQNTSLLIRGSLSGGTDEYYTYVHYQQDQATITVAKNGTLSGQVDVTTDGDGAVVETNYGTVDGGVVAFGGLQIDNYGSFHGTQYSTASGSTVTVNLFTGSSNTAIAYNNDQHHFVPSSGVHTVINLRLDDRPATAANTDVGANSGVTSATLHDVSGYGTLDVQSGTWTLTDSETYSTSVTIENGASFVVAGSGTLGGATLQVAGTLSGTGTTGAVSVQSDGAITTGDETGSGGVLHTGNLAMASGGHFDEHLSASTSNEVSVTGSVTLGGATLDLDGASGSPLALGTTVVLIANDGTDAVSGTFANLTEGATAVDTNGHHYRISYEGGDGNDVTLTRVSDQPPPSNPSIMTYDLSMLTPGSQPEFKSDNALYIPGTTSDVVASPSSGGVTLTYHGNSYVFADGTLSTASEAGHVSFSDGTQLLVGTDTGNDMLTGLDTGNHEVFGFGGADDINVGNGNNLISGGLGSDIVYAYEGNNHIWGNAQGGVQGQPDGADHIVVNGGGSNYVNGNAGDDTIEVGTGGSTGANRLYGGAGQDTIILHGAGANSVNGNMGQDTIDASDATGNNLLRGGQGDDVIRAGHGRDQLLGDLGADTLVAGTGTGHLTIMTGGADADTFDFSHGPQGQVTVAGTTYQSGVTDFAHGTDHIGLAFALGSGDLLTSSTTFSDVASAQAYAQSLLSSHAGTTDVAALQVGGDTVLFYDAAGTADAVDSIVRLSGVTSTTLTTGDFVIGA